MNWEKEIKDSTERLLGLLGVEFTITVKENELDGIKLDMDSPDSALLIGRHGETLMALEHIVRTLMIHRAGDDPKKLPNFGLDVEGYKQKQIDEIVTSAREAADEVKKTGESKILSPMNSFERRVVHTILKEHADLETESIGVEPNRRIVIKPKI